MPTVPRRRCTNLNDKTFALLRISCVAGPGIVCFMRSYIRNPYIAAHSQHLPPLRADNCHSLPGKLQAPISSRSLQCSRLPPSAVAQRRPTCYHASDLKLHPGDVSWHSLTIRYVRAGRCPGNRHSRDACSSIRPMRPLVGQATTELSRRTTWSCDGACLRPSGVAPTLRTPASFWPWAILVCVA